MKRAWTLVVGVPLLVVWTMAPGLAHCLVPDAVTGRRGNPVLTATPSPTLTRADGRRA